MVTKVNCGISKALYWFYCFEVVDVEVHFPERYAWLNFIKVICLVPDSLSRD